MNRNTDIWTRQPESESPIRKPIPSSESLGATVRRRWDSWIARGRFADDEPGSWDINAGGLVWQALTTARGKPDSPLKILIVGTLAPLATGAGHFYYDLVDKGSVGDVHVTALRGNPTKWDSWPEIRRVNPLMSRYPESRKELLKERDAATS